MREFRTSLRLFLMLLGFGLLVACGDSNDDDTLGEVETTTAAAGGNDDTPGSDASEGGETIGDPSDDGTSEGDSSDDDTAVEGSSNDEPSNDDPSGGGFPDDGSSEEDGVDPGMSSDDPIARTDVVSEANRERVLRRTLETFSARALKPSLVDIPMDPALYGTLIETVEPPEIEIAEATVETYACDNGGTVTRSFLVDTGNEFGDLQFDDCATASLRFDGQASYELLARSARTVTGLGISLVETPDVRVTVDGRVQSGPSRSWFDEQVTRNTVDFDWAIAGTGADWSVEVMNTELYFGEELTASVFEAFMEGTFSLVMPEVTTVPLSVTTPAPFEYRSEDGLSESQIEALADGWTFTSGRLRVEAPDGSGIAIDASGDSSETFFFETIASDGTIERTLEDWASWRDALRIEVDRATAQTEPALAALAARLRTLSMR